MAIAIPAAALLVPAGGAAAAMTQNARQIAAHAIQGSQMPDQGMGACQPAGTFAWHKLVLLNGWESSQGIYLTGNPSYAISGVVVYLSGGIDQAPGFTNPQVTVLPAAARPSRILFITVWAAAGDTGTLTITPDGRVTATSLAGDSTVFTSLAAVSYPRSS